VLDALRHNEHLARRELNGAVAKIDPQRAVEHDERLVGVVVIVPDEVALQLDDLELIVVHLSNDLRLPLLVEQSELFCEVDRLVTHPGIRQARRAYFARTIAARRRLSAILPRLRNRLERRHDRR
jgi:hypothetical protein